MQNSYTPYILTFEELNAKIVSKQITLPKFQRNVVWGKQKIMKLIESLQKGYPFGSLLLYKKDEENFKLIDGLQRYSAISKYSKEPMEYLPDFDEKFAKLQEDFLKLKEESGNSYSEAEFEKIIEKVRENVKKYKLESSTTSLVKHVDDKGLAFEMVVILEKWIQEIKNQINFADLKIPVIYFEGDEESLTEVFQNINEGGKPLSKYEIFASAWSDYEIQDYSNSDIMQVLRQRYADLQEKLDDLSLDFEFNDEATINIFEYCFALSKLVANQLSKESQASETDSTKIDTIGFSLIAATLGIKNKELHKIGDVLKNWTPKSLNEFQKIIVENSGSVMNTLYNKFSYNQYYFPKNISEFQLVSFIAARIKIQYTIQQNGSIAENNESEVKQELKVFTKNIELYFLKNLIEKNWGNAGDTKLDESLGLNTEKRYLLYLSGVDEEGLVQAFNSYMEEQKNTNPIRVSAEAKCLLAWLQTKIDQHEGNSKQFEKYDIEHIVPKQILQKNKLELVSPLANLCILPTYDNRSKKNQTLYEWTDQSGTLSVVEEDVEKYLYPSKTDMKFVSNHFQQLDNEIYLEFLERRQKILVEKFRYYVQKI